VRQGVTTLICGQDGVAFAPGTPEVLAFLHDTTAGFNGRVPPETFAWRDVAGSLARLTGAAVNAALLVPNGNARMMAMGLAARRAAPAELAAMRDIVRDNMAQGAVGLSSGLDYVPSLYADEDELAALCEEIAPFGGVYVTHMRGYSPAGFATAFAEAVSIGRRAKCAVHISHFNVLAEQALPALDAAIASGVDVTFDLYPYLHGSTTLAMLTLPPPLRAGTVAEILARLGGAEATAALEAEFAAPRFPLETVRLASLPQPDGVAFEGRLLVECAADMKVSPAEFTRRALVATRLQAGVVVRHFAQRTEADIAALMRHPAMMAGSDGIYVGGFPHPRGTGTFVKYLGEHVRNGTWTLEEAVQKLADAPARRHGLADRGRLGVGFAADIAAFDPAAVRDASTYTTGRALAEGMRHVAVNGELVLRDGQRTPARPGRGLPRSVTR
jgi:N-acyl-D-amino-acid deacylase